MPALTELSRLKAENFKLKVQLSSCTSSLSNAQFVGEQEALVKTMRKELKADDQAIFNWDTYSFTPPAAGAQPGK